ncbi:MAG: VOC family protein [Actinomycetales bacterium]
MLRDTAWPPGTPCWVDITTRDLGISQSFYSVVLGWDYLTAGPEFSGYCTATIDSEAVAGLRPPAPFTHPSPGTNQTPAEWSVYLATDDIESTHELALAHGAEVIVPPTWLGDLGAMGRWVDPTGAAFGAWQAGRNVGATVVNEVGALAWCDLMTADLPAALDFYAAVFGLTYRDEAIVGHDYVLFRTSDGERPAGGIGASPEGSSGWGTCFETEDVAAAAARIERAGGTILQQPWDFEYGRLMAAAGPDGETFTLITTSGPGSTQ